MAIRDLEGEIIAALSQRIPLPFPVAEAMAAPRVALLRKKCVSLR